MFAALRAVKIKVFGCLLSLQRDSRSKNIRDLYRGINEFKRGHQPRNNLVKDENCDLLADSHNILNM
jgi:hypothetical protein